MKRRHGEMSPPPLSEEQVTYLIERGHRWLLEQRDAFCPGGRTLRGGERLPLQDYYDERVLDGVRLAAVERISNPGFYGEMANEGYPVLDISGASAIAFIDCVLIRSEFQRYPSLWASILFHELVHVVQYDILGSRRTIESYIRSWIGNGFDYQNTPLEAQAERLEARFGRGGPPFSVREVVERELKGLL